MARDFRSSRFRGRAQVGEDINPSAYIVNLADCMLVLACGFLVALISLFNLDLGPVTTEVDSEEMEQVDPETLEEDITEGSGSYYIEAGKVYRDPNTGVLYMVTEDTDDADGEASASGSSASSASSASQTN